LLYGQELESPDFLASCVPSNSQVQAVVSYLQGAGFQNVQVEPNNLMIAADRTATAVQSSSL
jgi:subtilase family serine protease